eukprot:gnl/TRDRNA2_/TRDRNA2_173785_c7_seq2.p1 gnl/TRDRNA2_/TRDRNA2_173785_c7~~gnl/TRDRNA2_/TRDRNA2_173785_c7_seq2.p1  ORF type:complete len:143 (+),score=21.65 gnl/TRDRNA2_/TRDRNA2_173785_c7_seq2:263-691(+)
MSQSEETLFAALSRAAERQLSTVQELANIAWAFARVGSLDQNLFAVLARTAEQHASEFDAQALFNTAWAFASSIRSEKSFGTVLAREAQRYIGDSRGLGMALWALSRHGDLGVAWSLFNHAKPCITSFSILDEPIIFQLPDG